MQRHELEHLIRAAAALTDQCEIVVIGSQSIPGAVPNAPAALLMSMEADVYPLRRPELADVIDGAIGELGYCLEPHDLAASKLAAGREKDWPFVSTILAHGLINESTLSERIATLPINAARKEALARWLKTQVAGSGGASAKV